MNPSLDVGYIAERAEHELRSDESGCLAGPLGEFIVNETGNYSLEFCSPEKVAIGIAKWLEDAGAPHCEGCNRRLPDDAPSYEPDGVHLCKDCLAPVVATC